MKTYVDTQNIGILKKMVPTCSCSYCEGLVLTKPSKLKAMLQPYRSEVLELFPVKEAH